MHIDRLADQPEWRRIGDAIDTDVIVAPELKRCQRPVSKARWSVFSFGFSCSANRLARVCAPPALKGRLFDPRAFPPWRHELVQAEEGAVAQWRQHPSLDLLHPIFRERFIPRCAAGWDNADPVMPRQRQIRLSDRIVKAGVGDARLQMSGTSWDRAAPGVEHPHMTAEPVFGGLRPRRFRVNDGGERQRANEDADLTSPSAVATGMVMPA